MWLRGGRAGIGTPRVWALSSPLNFGPHFSNRCIALTDLDLTMMEKEGWLTATAFELGYFRR